MTQTEMIALIQEEVKSLDSYLDSDDYENSCTDASRELGWSFPVSGDFKIHWMKLRAKRWLFFYLWTETAHKFKFKQINLQHRFEHYKELIAKMDADYKEAVEENPTEFADVSVVHMFGTKVDAGFAYDSTGNDITYDEDQLVIFHPDEND